MNGMKKEELRRRGKEKLLEKGSRAAKPSKRSATARNAAIVENKPVDVVAEVTKAISALSKEMEAKMDARFAEVSHAKSGNAKASHPSSAGGGAQRDAKGRPNGASRWNTDCRPRSRTFCYKCGEDGHFRSQCENRRNPDLVYCKLNQEN